MGVEGDGATLTNTVSGTITVQVRATIGQRSTTVPLVISSTTFTPKDFGIAVNPTTGVMYGKSTNAAGGGDFYTIDKATGQATAVGLSRP